MIVSVKLKLVFEPKGSVAVRVMVAVPAAKVLTVSVSPDTLTVAFAVSEELAVYVNVSPSGSLK